MKYTTLPYDDSLTHGPIRVIVDKESDIKDLPKDFSAGSKAIVAESGKTYLLNNKQEWKKQPASTGGSNNAASEISIVQTIDSSSAQDAIPSAKAVHDFVTSSGGITQSEAEQLINTALAARPTLLMITCTNVNGTPTLDKTWKEINDVFKEGGVCRIIDTTSGYDNSFIYSITGTSKNDNDGYAIYGYHGPRGTSYSRFEANSENDYPALTL